MIMKKTKVLKTPAKTIDTKEVKTKTTYEEDDNVLGVIRPYFNDHNSDGMRDLFFIIKGRYQKGLTPSFTNQVTGDTSYVGGYDPERETTEEWYMCVDKVTYHCIGCGSDFNKVLYSVYTQIMKFKGNAKKYFKYVSDITSDDYYEVHYLGHSPLSADQRSKKCEGRCPRTSPPMRCLHNAIYQCYGDFFREQVQEMEDQAYRDLEEVIKQSRPINKARKIMKKTPVKKVEMETPKTPEKGVNTKLKELGKTKLGVKKLVME